MSVTVVGAGIMGLSSAIQIQKLESRAKVKIIAENFSPKTVSDLAAGYWRPVCVEHDETKLKNWGQETFALLKELCRDDVTKYGCGYKSGYDLDETKREIPYWSDVVLNFRRVPEHEFYEFGWTQFKDCFFYTTCYMEPTKYLAYLLQQFKKKGGEVVQKKLENLDDVDKNCDVIVNCSGMGAYWLANDRECFPIRGQIYRVKASFMKHFIRTNHNYILLNNDYVILGGTHQYRDWRANLDESDSRKIWHGCVKLVPAIKNVQVIDQFIGLRPGRSKVRLELENREDKNPIIHCYGHGGSGMTLFHGCAKEVASLCRDVLHSKNAKL